MLTLYTNPMSRGRIARFMLEEVGQPYETVFLDFGEEMRRGDYRAINPMAKVPALVHDGHVVTEVAAICTYLAMAFPEKGLMAEDKAAFFRWMFFGAGPLEAGRTGYGSLDRVTRTLTGHLERNYYFADNRFTAADVYVGSQIGWGLRFGTIPANDALKAYWDRISTRPALAAANAKDDAALPPRI
jgi:glutathione S-transferase